MTDTMTVNPSPPAPDYGDRPQQLTDHARKGSQFALALLFRRHHATARRFAAYFTRSPVQQDDLVSDAFERIARALRHGHGPSDDRLFRAYLAQTIRSAAYDHLRRHKAEQLSDDIEVADVDADPMLWVISQQAAKDTSLGVLRALRELPIRWRLALWLVDIERLPEPEVAALLRMRVDALRHLVYRARRGLRTSVLADPQVAS